ncbi:lipoate--protein ligase family protein [Enterococcus hirae]|uniref:lipoate--protein ligase family protein n=1 Tax=Enterococcus TaxID=1350 RepID=UPI0015978E3B|nr:lipoate--protein ligase family protein [Enterococcus hirae]EMF0260635.1 lipoate--protein ligase family protein [Enterococcus hirae]MDU1931679.1 lipoate--protein ligase family protein [Enterococcus hirae]QKX70354.1 lipoate--protein ligase family protein [Enterococcus hirae]
MNPTIILDQKIYQKNDFTPFALTDILTEYSKKNNQNFLHFWQYEQTVILGMKDTRTSYFHEGIQELRKAGYQPIVRNAGGLGIISDQGVLNLSLIFPQNEQEKISIDAAYEKMLTLTRLAFPTVSIEAFEVTHSYCPGTYDLSINGKKFAGIAQRRIKNGISVMMYVSVNGAQQTRGQAMKRFYQEALKEDFGTNGYPAVVPESMATLADLLETPLTIEDVKQQFQLALTQLYGESRSVDALCWKEAHVTSEQWTDQINRMEERNKLKELADDYSL